LRNLKNRLVEWWSGQDSHVVDLVRGASIAGVLKVLSAVFTFGLAVVLGRVLGADAAGVYFLALTTATIAATIGRVGLDSAVIRLVSSRASSGNWSEVRSVYSSTMQIGLTCSVVFTLILILAAGVLAREIFSNASLEVPLRLMALAVVPLALNVLVSRALQGLSSIRDSIMVFSILPAGIALVGTWLVAASFGVNGAIASYIVGVTIALFYGLNAWRRALAGHEITAKARREESSITGLLRSGMPLLIGALLQLMIQMSGTLMLGIWAENTDVSIFAIAWRTAILINFVLIAVNAIAQPKFAELYSLGDMEKLASTARRATTLMTICAAPVFLLFLLIPGTILSTFGSDFSGGALTLQILSIGQFINVATGSVGILLVMSGHEREYRNVQIVAAGVVLVLSYLLIPQYGAVGAAIGAAAALIVQNVLFGYFVWARLRILTISWRRHGK
jgi:O-antigen/teichoic acid export membrane protein